jgi:hypothetical protein
VKVISVHQPNALLVAHGYQTILTREYDTGHRGWLAIHATKRWPDDTIRSLAVWPTLQALAEIMGRDINPNEAMDWMPRGAIVGVAWLAKTERTDGITERWNRREDTWKLDAPDYNDVPQWEPTFGDFKRGRRAWWLCHPVALRTPIPVDGLPGMWDTETAATRDGIPTHEFSDADHYESRVLTDIRNQGVTLPDQFDPPFFRLISRRGETPASLPRNM